jgi:hypothetical protein
LTTPRRPQRARWMKDELESFEAHTMPLDEGQP